MKNFYLIPNSEKKDADHYAQLVKKYIEERGGTVLVTKSIRLRSGEYSLRDAVPQETEAVITLGGDGTIIQGATNLAEKQLPIIGFNLGTLGFLTETDREQIEGSLDLLLEDHYETEERMMLFGRIVRDGQTVSKGIALNDIVLHAFGQNRALHFEFLLNNEHLKNYFADGIIISTPTGSTAYNLSAGGPIVMPSADMIVATPINPHSLISRSIVLPPDAEITLRILDKAGVEAAVNFDSLMEFSQADDEIRIRRSEIKTKLIRLNKGSFIEVLRTKLEN